jgi:mRNA interferase RelE/StbE
LAWQISYTNSAERELKKLDKQTAKRMGLDYVDKRVAKLDDARSIGEALTGPLGTYWRYRVGDYRVICDIQDKLLLVLVVRIGHRRDIYY